MEKGWIKFHRKITEWEWYCDVNTFKLFFHLVISANHKDKKWQGFLVKRGQLIASIGHLAAETGLSAQKVRTALNHLESTKEVTRQATNRFTLLTVCNYDTYQSMDDVANKPNNNQLTNDQQTTNKQLTTNKNVKNVKNVKNERNNTTPAGEKKSSFQPPSLSEWLDYSSEYATGYFDFPISKTKIKSLLTNSYEYWFDNDCKNWKKKKRVDWKKVAQTKVRSVNTGLKDWEAVNKKKMQGINNPFEYGEKYESTNDRGEIFSNYEEIDVRESGVPAETKKR